MNIIGLAAVLLSSVLHVTWNLWMKKAGGGLVFLWFFNIAGTILYLPFALLEWQADINIWHWYYLPVMLGSAFLNLCYFITLHYAYRETDLSVVYPLCRGSMPVIALFLAILLLHEQPGIEAVAGTIIVAVGVGLLIAGPRAQGGKIKTSGIIYALLSGTALAFFALWDKYAIYHLKLPPISSYIGTMAGQSLMYLPLVWQNKPDILPQLLKNKKYILGVAFLAPLSYMIILWTMTFMPLSYIMPVRSSSIVISTLIGILMLKEGHAKVRLLSSVTIVIGIILVALDKKIL